MSDDGDKLTSPHPITPRPGAPGGNGKSALRPVFFERQTYRRRRLVDAACVLPFLGVILWWLPLLWDGTEAPVSASRALVYIFTVWIALPVAAGLLIWSIGRLSSPDRPEPQGTGPQGGQSVRDPHVTRDAP